MTQVDFFLLPEDQKTELLPFACRLLEKAYRQGGQVYVKLVDAEQVQALDQLLWTFRQGSFIPHAAWPTALASRDCPIILGVEEAPEDWREVLLNLSGHLPEQTGVYGRIIELVGHQPTQREGARQRFRQYRELGLNPQTTQLAV